MKARIRMAIATATVLAATMGGAPIAAAQVAPGSSVGPIVVPRPFDIPIWQLPLLPYPLEWEFHLPHIPAPAPAPAPKYGDFCTPEQVFQVYDRKLVCVYAGRSVPSWVYVAPEALNPDGTLNRNYPAG